MGNCSNAVRRAPPSQPSVKEREQEERAGSQCSSCFSSSRPQTFGRLFRDFRIFDDDVARFTKIVAKVEELGFGFGPRGEFPEALSQC
jgi:hypothetical protein